MLGFQAKLATVVAVEQRQTCPSQHLFHFWGRLTLYFFSKWCRCVYLKLPCGKEWYCGQTDTVERMVFLYTVIGDSIHVASSVELLPLFTLVWCRVVKKSLGESVYTVTTEDKKKSLTLWLWHNPPIMVLFLATSTCWHCLLSGCYWTNLLSIMSVTHLSHHFTLSGL